MSEPPTVVFALRRHLAQRLGPLALLLLSVLSISAPVAFLVMGSELVRERAITTAEQLARSVEEDVRQRPLLWRYELAKVAARFAVHRDDVEIRRIELVDAKGRLFELGMPREPSEEPLLWVQSAVEIAGRKQADVWVGASTQAVERQAYGLLLIFFVLGSGLAGLMYWLPLRGMGIAERKIDELIRRLQSSQQALASLNQNLESQVVERSSQLEAALVQVQEKELHVRELSRRATEVQESEGRALSRELHDSAGQTMTAIRIHAQMMAMQSEVGSPIHELAGKNVELIDATLEEIRRIVQRLAPSVLDDLGLAGAVTRLCEDFEERYPGNITLTIEGFGEEQTQEEGRFPGRDGELGGGVEQACYRVVQESLTNVARHAHASRIEVSLVRSEDRFCCRIRDNGEGFDPVAAQKKQRRGLLGMRERIELLGGELQVKSSVGEGSEIEMTVVLTARESRAVSG